MDDVDRIIAGLSEATKFAVAVAAECKDGEFWTSYVVGDTRLAKCGVLTQLGEAVRQRLQEREI